MIRDHRLLAIGIVLTWLFGAWGTSRAQTRLMTRVFGSRGFDSAAGVAMDADGNAYVVGTCGSDLGDQKNAGQTDIFLVKYSAAGKRQWTRLVGTEGEEIGRGIAVDAHGNSYVTGWSTYTTGSPATPTRQTDGILVKFSPDGVEQWSRRLGAGTNGDAVALDGAGNVYVAGCAFGPTDGQAHAGGSDVLLVKFDASGTRQWTRLSGTREGEVGLGLAVDAVGSVYVAGVTDGSLDGQAAVGCGDIFLMRYDGGGNKRWTRLYGSIHRDNGFGVAIDRDGNAYVAGSSYRPPSRAQDSGKDDILLLKFLGDGTLAWSELFGTDEDDEARGVAVDRAGDIYVVGTSFPDRGRKAKRRGHPTRSSDLFLAKFESQGTRQWTRLGGTSGTGGGVAVDGDGNILLVGTTNIAMDQEPYAGASDVCLIKFAPYAPSFDCARARTLQERLICQNAQLSALDASIAELYAAELRISARPGVIRAEQRSWLSSHRNRCTTAEQLEDCMRERVDALKAVHSERENRRH